MFQGLAPLWSEWWAAQANVCQLQILHSENTSKWLSTSMNHIGNSVVHFSVSNVNRSQNWGNSVLWMIPEKILLPIGQMRVIICQPDL